MLKKNSFTFVIHSSDAVLVNGANYYFDIGNLSSSYDRYLIEVLSATINTSVNGNNGFLMLVADDLAEDGVYTQNKLNGNQCLLTSFNVTVGGFEGNNDIFFRSKDLRMKRRIKMTLKKPNFDDCVDGTDINVGGIPTVFCIILQMTGLESNLMLGGSF